MPLCVDWPKVASDPVSEPYSPTTVHTLGELCLSPVGLSLVTKISPEKVVGLMMGFWFLAASLGNFFAGLIASFADRYPLYRIFTLDFILPAVGAIALAMLIRPLRSLSAKATASSVSPSRTAS